MRRGFLFSAILLIAGFATLMVATRWALPRVITLAYGGASLRGAGPRVVRWGGPDREFALHRLLRYERAGIGALAILAAIVGLRGRTGLNTRPLTDLADRVVGKATPGELGAIRCLIFGVALLIAMWEDLPSLAALPGTMRGSMGVMDWAGRVPGYGALAGSATALGALQAFTCLALAMAMLGLASRWSMPLGTLGFFLMGGLLRQYTKFYHTGLVPTYLAAAVTLMPAADGWSLDRLIRQARGRPVPDADRPRATYAWCRHLCWMLVALPYLFACLSKIRYGGWGWWGAENLRSIVYADALNPMHFDWNLGLKFRAMPDWMFAALGLGALASEGLFPLVLVSRAARWVFPPAMIALHLGILILQDVFFVDLILLQLMFIDWRSLRLKLAAWLDRGGGALEVLYDAASPAWRRARPILEGLDLLHRLRFVDAGGPEAARLAAEPAPGDGRAGDGPDLAIVQRGRPRRGLAACRAVAWALPAGWPIAPWLYLPGAGAVARLAVAAMTGRRGADPAGGAPVAEGGPPPSGEDSPRPVIRRAGLVTAGLLLVAWACESEYYPLTSWTMYSSSNLTGIVRYYKILAHHEDGRTTEAKLDRWVGAMADSRYRFPIHVAFHWSSGYADPLLAACLERARAGGPDERSIRSFEVQEWEWDYRRHPDDPSRARLTGTIRYPAPAEGATAEARRDDP